VFQILYLPVQFHKFEIVCVLVDEIVIQFTQKFSHVKVSRKLIIVISNWNLIVSGVLQKYSTKGSRTLHLFPLTRGYNTIIFIFHLLVELFKTTHAWVVFDPSLSLHLWNTQSYTFSAIIRRSSKQISLGSLSNPFLFFGDIAWWIMVGNDV